MVIDEPTGAQAPPGGAPHIKAEPEPMPSSSPSAAPAAAAAAAPTAAPSARSPPHVQRAAPSKVNKSRSCSSCSRKIHGQRYRCDEDFNKMLCQRCYDRLKYERHKRRRDLVCIDCGTNESSGMWVGLKTNQPRCAKCNDRHRRCKSNAESRAKKHQSRHATRKTTRNTAKVAAVEAARAQAVANATNAANAAAAAAAAASMSNLSAAMHGSHPLVAASLQSPMVAAAMAAMANGGGQGMDAMRGLYGSAMATPHAPHAAAMLAMAGGGMPPAVAAMGAAAAAPGMPPAMGLPFLGAQQSTAALLAAMQGHGMPGHAAAAGGRSPQPQAAVGMVATSGAGAGAGTRLAAGSSPVLQPAMQQQQQQQQQPTPPLVVPRASAIPIVGSPMCTMGMGAGASPSASLAATRSPMGFGAVPPLPPPPLTGAATAVGNVGPASPSASAGGSPPLVAAAHPHVTHAAVAAAAGKVALPPMDHLFGVLNRNAPPGAPARSTPPQPLNSMFHLTNASTVLPPVRSVSKLASPPVLPATSTAEIKEEQEPRMALGLTPHALP